MGQGEHPTRGWRHVLRTFLLCCAMAGVQFVYSIQFSIGAPLLNQRFKLSNSMIGVILTTSGAISGFIVQPIVGVYSDSCTSKWGRRRPFILVGAILCVLGMAMVGNSPNIGILLGDNDNGTTPSEHKFGLLIAITFLWVINLSVNAMQGPSRALIADCLPPEEQQFGNAILMATTGLSNVIAYLIGAQVLEAQNPYRLLFMIGCAFTTVCTIPTLLMADEKQYIPEGVVNRSPLDAFMQIGKTFISMPNVVVRIFIVFFFSWCAYSPFLIYLTTYYGYNVENFNPKNFNRGVQLGFYGLALNAVVSFLYGISQTFYLKHIGIKPTYFITQVVATVCFAAMWALSVWNHLNVALALVFTALVSMNFTAFNSIPFALLADSVPNSKMGLYMGVLNSAATLSQVFTNIVAGKGVVAHAHENVAWAFLVGAVLSAIAALLVWIVKIPEKSDTPERDLLINREDTPRSSRR